MITALDTNILLADKHHCDYSKKLLDAAVVKEQLIISEIVYGEFAARFPLVKELHDFLLDTGNRLVHSSENAFYVAGELWRESAGIKNKLCIVMNAGS